MIFGCFDLRSLYQIFLREYLERAEKRWLKWFGERNGAVTASQLKAAYQVLNVALQQRSKSKVEALVKDPTIEDIFEKE